MPVTLPVNTCAGTKIYYPLCPHVETKRSYYCAIAGPGGNHSFCGFSKSKHPRCVNCQFEHGARARAEIAELEVEVEKVNTELKGAKIALEERDAEIKELRDKLVEMEEAAKRVKVVKVEVKCQALNYAPCTSKTNAALDGEIKDVPSPTSSTSSFFDTVLIRDESADEINNSGSSTSVSPSQISNNAASSILSKLPILELLQPTPGIDAHGRSKRQRTTVGTYNVKILAGTAIHTPQKFSKDPAIRDARKRKRT